jgi:hypothetical protein
VDKVSHWGVVEEFEESEEEESEEEEEEEEGECDRHGPALVFLVLVEQRTGPLPCPLACLAVIYDL